MILDRAHNDTSGTQCCDAVDVTYGDRSRPSNNGRLKNSSNVPGAAPLSRITWMRPQDKVSQPMLFLSTYLRKARCNENMREPGDSVNRSHTCRERQRQVVATKPNQIINTKMSPPAFTPTFYSCIVITLRITNGDAHLLRNASRARGDDAGREQPMSTRRIGVASTIGPTRLKDRSRRFARNSSKRRVGLVV